VELPADLNPFIADGVRIFAKMVPLVPLMNIKSIPAYSMLNKASERGELDGVNNVIESSSSNTVLSLSVMAKLFGIEKTTAIVDHSIAPALLRMLRLFGIDIMLHPAAGHELFGKLEPRSERATNCGKQEGWINPGQYSNPDNPEGFARWLAPDLFAQTGGKLALLSCALGTCGTMVGVSRGLRNLNPDVQVLACCPQPGDAIPGPRERSLLKDVEFPWQDVANYNEELTTTESFVGSIKLLRRGILGGPSSGMNYVGLLKHLETEKEAGRLAQTVREQGGEYWTAFLSCDSPLPHVEEYYEVLGEEYFPEVHPVPDLIE
jgi:cysteine synthase A